MGLKYSYHLFLLFCLVLITLLLGEAVTYFLDINQLLYKNLSERLTLQQIESYFENQARWGWIKYLLLPAVLFLKTTIMAWVLAIGGFFHEIELPHKKYWEIVLQAEFVFLFAGGIKILWFLFIKSEFTLGEIQQFSPFSLQSVLDTASIPFWAMYPLQLLNAFEIIYWAFLVLLLNQATKTKKGLQVVLTAYAPALVIWVIFIMFLTLNFS